VGSIDHVTIRVSDVAASRGFYDTVLAPLGFVDPYVGEAFAEWGDFSITAPKTGEPVTLHRIRRYLLERWMHSTLAMAADTRATMRRGARRTTPATTALRLDPDGNNVEPSSR
jgi:catechol 2,3-dioxygenase-like lactoylglutathione lyase family enzyme